MNKMRIRYRPSILITAHLILNHSIIVWAGFELNIIGERSANGHWKENSKATHPKVGLLIYCFKVEKRSIGKSCWSPHTYIAWCEKYDKRLAGQEAYLLPRISLWSCKPSGKQRQVYQKSCEVCITRVNNAWKIVQPLKDLRSKSLPFNE